MTRARRGAAPPPPAALDLFGSMGVSLPEAIADSAPEPLEPEPAPGRRGRGRKSARAKATEGAGAAAVAEPRSPSEYGELPGDGLESIPGASPASAVSVTTLTRTAKDVLEGAFVPLWVCGEVSDFKAHRNGHWYFSLRDAESQVKCVVWSRDQRRFLATPDDGMSVVALGQPSVYAARGEMQFSVKAMQAQGDGLWRKAFDATLARLAAEGLLAPERKRPVPRFPRRIVAVTSPDGAALHDIVSVARRRCPNVEVILVAAKVQGDGAPEELCAALDRVARWGGADVVIVGRGGGSRDDLWAFNDERVARAVAACRVPTISAVGHEVDVTLCDLVADLRAPTPSAAAEAATPVLAEQRAVLSALGAQLLAATRRRLTRAAEELGRTRRDVSLAAEQLVERRRARLDQAAGRLNALSPLATLARGYAVVWSHDGDTLGSARGFSTGTPFHLLLRDGVVSATASAVRRGNPTAFVTELRAGTSGGEG
ncbi:MAG TPA: exodeoxyribonuclease VII large subunit [Gemmatimonadaceae bacterium]|nr:exodeoxyribonuclease VII large subunit [Gemmatimonadaceae bacterium]